MTEVTRVPLQPIAKGSLTKLWLGVIVAILIGAGLAWSAMPSASEQAQRSGELFVETIVEGEGAMPGPEDVVFVKYKGMLADEGTVFDETQDEAEGMPPQVREVFPDGTPLPLAQMLPGFRDGAVQMQKGGKYELFIPSDQAYGSTPPPGAPIPPDADLLFEVELIDFMTQAEFQEKLTQLQQMLGIPGGPQGGAAGAGPDGAPVPPPSQ